MIHPYATRAYAEALPHLGAPIRVAAWDNWMHARPLPFGARHDVTGAYPVAIIPSKADIAAGFRELAASGAVSLVLVLEDALRPDAAALEAHFDVCRPFKTHYLHDRAAGPPTYSKHHRYEVRRALTKVTVREIALAAHLQAWIELYAELTARHGLGGLHQFPAIHHHTLARLDGVRTFAAFAEEVMVSAHIFVVHDGCAMSHLAASSAKGYRAGAAYAVNDLAMRALADCRIINFGGAAGMTDGGQDGLARFKQGFSNATAHSYLCCKILDVEAYEALSAGYDRGGFFPAYRGRRQEKAR